MALEKHNNNSINNYPLIKLADDQHASGIWQGQERQEQSYLLGLKNQRGLEANSTAHITGSLGEVAGAIFLDLPFKYSINEWSEPDNISKRGNPIDFKTSTNPHFLNISPRHVHPNWFYVLIWAHDEYTFSPIGYIKGSNILSYSLTDNNRNSPYYKIPAADLTQFPHEINK